MKKWEEKGRKVCSQCGAHKIMRFPSDNTCPVCGDSLRAAPVIEKKRGYLMSGMKYVRFPSAN